MASRENATRGLLLGRGWVAGEEFGYGFGQVVGGLGLIADGEELHVGGEAAVDAGGVLETQFDAGREAFRGIRVHSRQNDSVDAARERPDGILFSQPAMDDLRGVGKGNLLFALVLDHPGEIEPDDSDGKRRDLGADAEAVRQRVVRGSRECRGSC